jgi:hypothetical protein
VPLSLTERVISRLYSMQLREGDPHLCDDLAQARLTVVYASQGSPIPFVDASYAVCACHPDQVWGRIVARRKAHLGRQYSEVFDASGNLRPQFLDIPDYDPTAGRPPLSSFKQESYKKHWTPKAPLRRVLQVNEIHEGGVTYHLEQLECGHTHTEFLDANPGKKRRRCRECATRSPQDLAITRELSHMVEQSGKSEIIRKDDAFCDASPTPAAD